MTENIQKIKDNFEGIKIKYDALNFCLTDLIRNTLLELRKVGKPIRFNNIHTFGTMCPVGSLSKYAHIHGVHFHETCGIMVDCLDMDNNEVSCHIDNTKFTTDEKYQFLNELMKHIQPTDNH